MKQKFSTVIQRAVWFIALALSKNWKLICSKQYGIRWSNTEYFRDDNDYLVKYTQNLTTQHAYEAEKRRRHNQTTPPKPNHPSSQVIQGSRGKAL